MKHGGDAVGDGLAIAVDQRDVGRKIDAGARHHLSLECITMQVDDARQHQEIARIDHERAASSASADHAVAHGERGILKFSAVHDTATFDEDVSHDLALRSRGIGWSPERASYLSRKSSMPSFLKSGSAARSAS
jgi:hypothetical protein